MLCIVIIAISAGSRALARVFSAPEKRAFRARNLFFFCISHCHIGHFWLRLTLRRIILCNHKHIQSSVNSVLIIAKALCSLSPSPARAFIIEASAKERKKEREKEIYIFFFLRRGKKKAFMKKRRNGKRRKEREREKTLRRKTTQNHHSFSSSFSFSFDLLTKKSIISRRRRRRDR